MTTHFHIIVWCADRIEPGTGNFVNNSTVEVICDTGEAALQRARFLVPGKNIYSVRQVVEHFGEDSCGHSH